MADFILEIGTEEIPARFLDDTQKELVERFTNALNELNLGFESIESFASPRRASLIIKNLEAQQEVKEEIFLGPAKKIAYNEDGTLSKAAQGFVRGHKVDEKDIFLSETEKGVYIAVKKQVGGLKAKEVLAEICPKLILALPFPKKMRWNTFSLAYARPIHTILALLDTEIINFSVGEVKSSNIVNGHRIHGTVNKEVKSAQEYFQEIKKEFIILNAEERKNLIIEQGNKIADNIQGKILWKESLLNEVKGLVEFPVPMLGDFDKSFLELPKEVLLTSMESHQKSFGLEDKHGKLLPHFLTVLNLEPKEMSIVKQGWERVLRARLEDARFFWKTDNTILKSDKFEKWLEKLDKVIFLAPLGSIGDKCRRLENLMEHSAELLNLNTNLASEAGKYAKVDLVSSMVNEFDTLQGIMGGIYAEIIGKKELGSALSGQYLPAGPETPVPQDDYAALLSLCDKLDTLVGLFGLNKVPTGAADPYALRRCAISIMRIMRDKAWNLDIQALFEKSYSLYTEGIKWKLTKEECLEKVSEFYYGRVKNLLLSEGNDPLFVESILHNVHTQVSYMSHINQKLKALKEFSQNKNYINTVQSFKRINNIIRKQAANYTLNNEIKTEFFENDAEKELAKLLASYTENFEKAYNTQDFKNCFNLLAEISPSIDKFFDSSMIMADDEKVRTNRLNLLYIIQQPLTKLTDFAALQI